MAWHISRCALPQNAFLGRRLRSVYLPERWRAGSLHLLVATSALSWGESLAIIDWLTGISGSKAPARAGASLSLTPQRRHIVRSLIEESHADRQTSNWVPNRSTTLPDGSVLPKRAYEHCVGGSHGRNTVTTLRPL